MSDKGVARMCVVRTLVQTTVKSKERNSPLTCKKLYPQGGAIGHMLISRDSESNQEDIR